MQHLDIGRQFEMIDLIGSLRREGIAILASMHDLALIEGVFSSVWLLSPDGAMRQGPPEQVLQPEILQARLQLSASPPSHAGEARPEPNGESHMTLIASPSLADVVADIAPCDARYIAEAQQPSRRPDQTAGKPGPFGGNSSADVRHFFRKSSAAFAARRLCLCGRSRRHRGRGERISA